MSSATGGGEAPNYTLSYATNASGAPATNRIANAGYSHDAAGNMTGDGAAVYTYDGANRLWLKIKKLLQRQNIPFRIELALDEFLPFT